MADEKTDSTGETPQPFPRSFWTANLTELFERGAYYAMASFVVQYLGEMGLGEYWPSTLNSFLWGIVYFLPILSGTIADRVGFKRSLLVAFVLLAIGYFLMGYSEWLGGVVRSKVIGDEATAGAEVIIPVALAILLIGAGGSVIKPCISGTVQKTCGPIKRATLGFAVFYMTINIGSLAGRGVSYLVRTSYNLSFIFLVSVAFSIIAFFAVLIFYRDPEAERGEVQKKEPKSIPRILADMVLVLRNRRFTYFLLVTTGFWFLYAQVYNVIPLYLKRVVDLDPPTDVITMANPFVIVFFQLVITKLFGKIKPVKSIIIGTLIIGVSMMANAIPIFSEGGVRELTMGEWVPMAFVVAALCVGLIAFGELFTSPRMYEFIGALAPKGEEGLFLGYANLPVALGALISGPVGAVIFNEIMCRNATTLENGLLDLDPMWNTAGWSVFAVIGLASALLTWRYNSWLKKNPI